MRTLVVYSSRTGNTRKIAEAVAKALAPCDIHPVEESPDPESYAFIAIGFWVDKAMPDARCRAYMARVQNKHVALFGTLGTEPSHRHAAESAARAEDLLLEGGNIVFGTFLSQGKIDPGVLAVMERALGGAPLPPERLARIKEAEKHPDEEDCRRAGQTMKNFFRAAMRRRNLASPEDQR